jgi:hypothetical protein
MDISPIFISLTAAILYSLLWYGRQVIDPTKPTPEYDPFQLVATMIVGAGVGVASLVSGIEITQASLDAQLLSYGFLIAVIEQVGKGVYRKFLVGFDHV